MEILHANMILLTLSIYPDILIVMIFRYSAFDVDFLFF